MEVKKGDKVVISAARKSKDIPFKKGDELKVIRIDDHTIVCGTPKTQHYFSKDGIWNGNNSVRIKLKS